MEVCRTSIGHRHSAGLDRGLPLAPQGRRHLSLSTWHSRTASADSSTAISSISSDDHSTKNNDTNHVNHGNNNNDKDNSTNSPSTPVSSILRRTAIPTAGTPIAIALATSTTVACASMPTSRVGRHILNTAQSSMNPKDLQMGTYENWETPNIDPKIVGSPYHKGPSKVPLISDTPTLNPLYPKP